MALVTNDSIGTILGDWVSDSDTQLCTFIVYGIVSGIVSVFGLVFNLINVIVFVKMGFSDTTNITLCCLAMCDTLILLTLLAYSVIYNPAFVEAVRGMQVVHALDYLPVGWPYVCFSRISGCLTTYVTLERFLCVALPLKVKSILTPRRAAAVNVSVYLVMIGATLPVFVGFQLGLVYNPDLNLTLLGLLASPESHTLENFSLSFNVFVQIATFFLVSVFTVGLIQLFAKKSEWRRTASSTNAKMSSRDKKLVKMIILIATIYIACSFPGVVGILFMLAVDDYNITGRYRNLFITTFATFFALGSINSTVTIFVYLDMSTRFREVLLHALHLKRISLSEKRRI